MILVSGGTGFIGRHLVDALIGRGDAVRVLTRDGSAIVSRQGLEVEVGDLLDPPSLARALRGVRTVVHLAARLPASSGDSADRLDFNIQGTVALADAARSAGAERFIHMSSAGVYGDGLTPAPHRETDEPHPGNAYERSKLAAEVALSERLAGSSLSWTILRPAGVYGQGRAATADFLREVGRRPLWLHATPNVIVHPTHISDVVQASLRVLDARVLDAPVLNVAGERALSFQEFVGLAAEAMGRRTRQLVLPAGIGRPIARAAARGIRAAHLKVPTIVDRTARPCINRALDTSLVRKLLDFTPVALASALRETATAMRES